MYDEAFMDWVEGQIQDMYEEQWNEHQIQDLYEE